MSPLGVPAHKRGDCVGYTKGDRKQFCVRGHDRTLPGAIRGNGTCVECQASRDRSHGKRRKYTRRNAVTLRTENRTYVLQRKYGIDLEFYRYLLEKQNGVCALCGKPETTIRHGKIIGLAVDHDHVTGKVRGLLCRKCNVSLGFFGDDIERLEKAIAYLKS